MSKQKKRSRQVRIETERSQPQYMTPTKRRSIASFHEEIRGYKNRITELEERIAELSRGEGADSITLSVNKHVMHVLERLTQTGLFGRTHVETAQEMLRMMTRRQMHWLATGTED